MEENENNNNSHESKKWNRRKFCSCMLGTAVSLSGGALLGCSSDNNGGTSFTGSITLTTTQVTALKSAGFLNTGSDTSGLMVFYTAPNTYKAYTRNCPHEGGTVSALLTTDAQCGKHTGQHFDISNNAKGNGRETSANLASYSVTENSDGTLTISS